MDNQQATQTQPMEGTSNPPNGGQVLDISNPEANDSTIPQAQAANQPEQPPTQATPPTGANGAPVQGNSANGPTPGQSGQPPKPGQDLSKGPTPTQVMDAQNKVQTQQAVQKAGKFHAMAEVLAGGPRYSYSVDDYGQMQKKKIPVSGQHLALAIAMEALGGAAAGLGAAPGPGVVGRAAAAGFGQGEKIAGAPNAAAKQQATEDYTRKVQAFETNMRMRSMAMQYGKMDFELNKQYDAEYAPVLSAIQQKAPGYLTGPISYDKLKDYNVTANNAIPAMTTERLDPKTGKQVIINGEPQYDHQYYIVKPGAKLSGLFTDDDLKTAKKYGYSWGDNTKLIDSPFDLQNYLNIKSQLVELNTVDTMLNHEFGKIDNRQQPTSYKIGKEPDSIGKYDDTVQSTASKYANTAKVSADDLSKYVRAIISQESGGNPNAKSPTGVKGIMQVSKATGQQYGLSDEDRNNPEKGIDAGTHYFADLLAKYKDPKLAMAAYYSGPGAIKDGNVVSTDQHSAADTKKYISDVSGKLGLEASEIKNTPEKADRVSMADWISKNPQSKGAFSKFMSAVNSLPQGQQGMWGMALEHLAKDDPQGAGSVAAFLNQGNPDTVRNHDTDVQTENEQRKLDEQTAHSQELADIKQANDEKGQRAKQEMLSTLDSANMPENARDMSANDLYTNLQQQGVTLPAEGIRDALAIANYDAPLSIASNKLWFKDKSLNQQDLLDIVKQINPDYKESNYKNLAVYNNPNSSAMKTIFATSGAANHLNMLLDAAKEVENKGNGAGQFPILNRLKNELNYQGGGDSYVQLAGLTNAINGEMGKVLSGGFAPDKAEIDALMKNMTAENSMEQIQKLAGMYTGIMHGKVQPIDESYDELSGRHLKGIPDSATKLFQKYGYETPWDKQSEQKSQANQQLQSQIPKGYKAMTKDGKFVQDMSGAWVHNPNQPQQSQPQQSNRAEQFVQSQQ